MMKLPYLFKQVGINYMSPMSKVRKSQVAELVAYQKYTSVIHHNEVINFSHRM